MSVPREEQYPDRSTLKVPIQHVSNINISTSLSMAMTATTSSLSVGHVISGSSVRHAPEVFTSNIPSTPNRFSTYYPSTNDEQCNTHATVGSPGSHTDLQSVSSPKNSGCVPSDLIKCLSNLERDGLPLNTSGCTNTESADITAIVMDQVSEPKDDRSIAQANKEQVCSLAHV